MVPCVYCVRTGQLRPHQLVLQGRSLYICAPRGQVVEGYLVIAPYQCMGCATAFPDEVVCELVRMKRLVEEFYAAAYNARSVLFYEQGRAGGGATAADFPLHAHLCGLPLDLDVHQLLGARYCGIRLEGIESLRDAAAGHPYVYLDSKGEERVYLPRTESDRVELAELRLKPMIAALAGMPERGYWRDHPGDREVAKLVRRFRSHIRRKVA